MGGQGCVIGQDCWVGVGGTGKQPSTMQETAITGAHLLLGGLGSGLGQGKNIFG